MGDVVELADAEYRRRQILIRRTVLAGRAAWSAVDPDRIAASWRSGPSQMLLALLTEAQYAAAASAAASVTAILAEQDLAGRVDGTVVAGAFAGVASDGRALAGLLDFAAQVALHQILVGTQPRQAVALGGRWLDQNVKTQLSDAHRAATQAATAAHRDVGGFTRTAYSPCCSRCAILSGRWYRYDAAFLRHPRCDCGQIPSRRGAFDGDDRVLTAESYFDSLSTEMQHRIFTVAGGSKYTRVDVPRLMPEQIYREARSRSDAVRLLQDFGYITRARPARL